MKTRGRPVKLKAQVRFLSLRVEADTDQALNELRYRWNLRNDSDTVRRALKEALERLGK